MCVVATGGGQAKLTDAPAKERGVVRRDQFAFMDSALALPMLHKMMPDDVYVPPFGSVLGFEPVRNGPALLIKAGCGRGKSFVFRQYMERVLADNPGARVLLLSANILYGSNLDAELRRE
eukprot:5718386-Prymnesium_polylepis.1